MLLENAAQLSVPWPGRCLLCCIFHGHATSTLDAYTWNHESAADGLLSAWDVAGEGACSYSFTHTWDKG